MLKGNQHKIDKNKNGKIDSHDFKLLRKMKKEETETGCGCGCPKCNSVTVEETDIEEQAPVAPTIPRKYIKGTPEHKAYKATKKPINGMPTNKEELELDDAEQLEERNKENAMKRKSMDASRGARYKVSGNPVPDRDPQHSSAQAHNKAIGRALRKEEEELDEVAKATGDLKDACWKGYTAVGMKMKNGKKVPNCVPVKEEEELDETVSEGIGSAVTGAVSMVKNVIKKEKEYQAQKQKKAGEVLSKMRKEESELDEKMNMSKADMGDVIKDFQKSDAPQFAGKSKEKRRQMAIAAKLQADRMKKEGVEMKSYRQFMEELANKLPEEQVEDVEVNEEVEQIDELDINLLKSMQKHAKANPRPKSSSDDAIDPKTGRLKPYGYRGKSEYEKSETGDDDEPKKRGRKTGVTVGSYKRRQPK